MWYCANEKGCPSLKYGLKASEADKKKNELPVAQKFRDVIKFTNCLKPRCIYASSMLYYNQEVAIHHAKHEEVCICGVVVLAEKSLFYTTFVVCRSLSFTLSPMRQNQHGYQKFLPL